MLLNMVRRLSVPGRWAALLGVLALSACRGVLGVDDAPTLAAADPSDAGDAALVTDAMQAADAGPTFCDLATPPPAFCDDFDHPVLVKYWDNSNRTPDIGASGGGTITVDSSDFRSAPQAAALAIPTLVDGTAAASGVLQKSLHMTPADLTIQLDVRISTEYFPAKAGTVPLVSISYGNEFIFVFRRASGTWLSVGNTGALVQLSSPIVAGQWTTLALSIKNHPTDGGADGELTVRLNQLNAAVVPIPAAYQTITENKLVVGPLTKGPVGAFRMTVDNVLIWTRSDL
jgi:hypothetical protein